MLCIHMSCFNEPKLDFWSTHLQSLSLFAFCLSVCFSMLSIVFRILCVGFWLFQEIRLFLQMDVPKYNFCCSNTSFVLSVSLEWCFVISFRVLQTLFKVPWEERVR